MPAREHVVAGILEPDSQRSCHADNVPFGQAPVKSNGVVRGYAAVRNFP